MTNKLSALILLVFFSLFVLKAFINMQTIPFHDFDEAHRAEKAKKMKEYFSFLIPLSGSPQDRIPDLRVPVKENPNLFIYYHPERPPFVYWLMITSTSILGTGEWAYRLPSLLMALFTVTIFVFSTLLNKKFHPPALFIGLTALITSSDLWLSGQYAQLDTTLTLFLTASLFSLILYTEKKRNALLVISSLSFSLAILSKGQPAAIFIFPVLYLLLTKRLSLMAGLKFCLYSTIILLPWLLLLQVYLGIPKFIKIFTVFAASSIINEYSFIKAPFFWYIRWWLDTLRPGFTLFLAFLIFDFVNRNINWKKATLLSYIIGGLALFSISANKLWWYVLPLIPAICFYIYLSASDYLERNKNGLFNISLVIFLASIPLFYSQTNTITLIYGPTVLTISFLILFLKSSKTSPLILQTLFVSSILMSLAFFTLHFPKIVPYHQNTKFVAQYFKSLPGGKCLLVKDMPPETALFYSDAGEIIPLTENTTLFPNCENYLITPEDILEDQITYTLNGQTLRLKDKSVLFQKGTMKLIKL